MDGRKHRRGIRRWAGERGGGVTELGSNRMQEGGREGEIEGDVRRGELRQGGMNLKEEGVSLWMESRWEGDMVDGKQMGGRNEG